MNSALRLSVAVAVALLTFLPSTRGQTTPVVTTLYSFTGTDGNDPRAGLVQGSNGNFYGTTYYGGSDNVGTVFSITPAGVLTTLHSFTGTGTDGKYVNAALVLGSDGNFYGTTNGGGNGGDGTVFSMTPAGVVTTLYSFSNTDGGIPEGTLVQSSDGNFYGTTSQGGSSNGGTVFSITPVGGLTTVYTFTGIGMDGTYPKPG